MTDVAEIKTLLEAQAARDDRRHEANIVWRTRMDGAVKTLTDQVSVVSQRQDAQEKRLDRHEQELFVATGRSNEALNSSAELEGKVIVALASQDKEIAHIRSETDKQTPILAKLLDHMSGQVATSKFLRWAVPLTGGAIVTAIPVLWWLFTALATHH